VIQRETISGEFDTLDANQPNQTYQLRRSGLIFPLANGKLVVEVADKGVLEPWTLKSDLRQSGPDDREFQLDYEKGMLLFGNGLNGHVPTADSALSVTYDVCEGQRGNLPAGVPWIVAGISGQFGVNSDVIAGGEDAEGLDELQSAVRRRSRESRPLVTSADLQDAALSFADLAIDRAQEMLPSPKCRQVRGTRTLVVLGRHDAASVTPITQEPRELLDEVRSRLVQRLPVGQRLTVVGPRYVPVRVQATLTVARKADPQGIKKLATDTLREKLWVASKPYKSKWPFGRDVTQASVKGWLRNVPGVAKVVRVALLAGDPPKPSPVVTLGLRDLPQLSVAPDDLTVERQPLGSER
jgi:predicted phage baseplate assembly protein